MRGKTVFLYNHNTICVQSVILSKTLPAAKNKHLWPINAKLIKIRGLDASKSLTNGPKQLGIP